MARRSPTQLQQCLAICQSRLLSLPFCHNRRPPPLLPAGAFTLEQAHILPTHTQQGLMRNPANEEQLWSYLVQLASALRCIHQAGLAARPGCLMPSKVGGWQGGWQGSCGAWSAGRWACGHNWVASLAGWGRWAPTHLMPARACPCRPPPPACRALGLPARPPLQVLVTSAGRVRIGSLGVPEVLSEAAGCQDVPQASRQEGGRVSLSELHGRCVLPARMRLLALVQPVWVLL
jgi:hypothetical protein